VGYTADHACKAGKCRVYGIYGVFVVRMVHIYGTFGIYLVRTRYTAERACKFGAACTECGKGYEKK
jgi:hypothetical protein